MIVCGGDLWLFDMVVENFVCLVVDLLFCFVVCEYGVGVIGVVFSGDFDDGVVGLVVICVWGGYGIVQDFDECEVLLMLCSVLVVVGVDVVVMVEELLWIFYVVVYGVCVKEQ